MRSPLAWLAVSGMLGAALVGCGGSNGTSLAPGSNPNGQTGGPPVNNTAFSMRVINASPDFGAIDVYVDGTRVWQNVKYGTFGTTTSVTNAPFYVSNFQPSVHNIAVYQAGASAGSATQQASVSTTGQGQRTTIVVADKQFGVLTTPALVALAFTEPTAVSPTSTANVIIHHAALNSLPGVVAYGSLGVNGSGQPFTVPTCLGTLTVPAVSTPNNTAPAIAKIPFVNSNQAPIGYYVALSGTANCTNQLAYTNPGSPNVLPSPGAVVPAGGLVYPSPAPAPPGQPAVPPYDTNSSLPATSAFYSASELATLTPNNYSAYIIDGPPNTGTTTPVPVFLSVFDPNSN